MLSASAPSPLAQGARVLRRRPVELSSLGSGAVDTAVVMDVLRMTTTAAVLLRRPSCDGAVVAATLVDLERLSRPLSEYVVVSELASAPQLGAWVDNSPAQVSRFDFGTRSPVLVTTNGTRALLAASACAARVLLASFRDLDAVARHLARLSPPSVVLVPAGHFASGERRVEDDLCADALEALLAGQAPDLEAAATAIRADERVRRRIEAEPGFSADLDLALERDPGAAALSFHPEGAGVGRIARA